MPPEVEVVEKKKVSVLWPTNINGKMNCHGFIHIGLYPVVHPGYRALENTVIEIRTEDDSHEPILVELLDIQELLPNQVREYFTMPSHGMTELEFANYFWQLNEAKLGEMRIGLYRYRKL